MSYLQDTESFVSSWRSRGARGAWMMRGQAKDCRWLLTWGRLSGDHEREEIKAALELLERVAAELEAA